MKSCKISNCINPADESEYCTKHQRAPARAHRNTKAINQERLKSPEWRAFRAYYLAKYPECFCGDKAVVVDHVKPYHLMGTDTWCDSDYQGLCIRHHAIKTAVELKIYG